MPKSVQVKLTTRSVFLFMEGSPELGIGQRVAHEAMRHLCEQTSLPVVDGDGKVTGHIPGDVVFVGSVVVGENGLPYFQPARVRLAAVEAIMGKDGWERPSRKHWE